MRVIMSRRIVFCALMLASVLCALIVPSVVTVSAQGGGRGAGQGGGRGAAQELSTSPYDIWDATKMATPGRLGNYGHYSASVQKRDVGAAPETHDGFSHFLVFTSGAGSVILGGEIVDGPDGKKVIKGGDTHKIVLGQMFHIPIKTPHQVVPNPGTSVTYWVTNINVPKP
jgi:mannose-6-phosphate isomerase-like protein (cupin superfamily)